MSSIAIVPFDLAWYEAVYALWEATEGVGLSEADEREHLATYLARNPGLSFLALDSAVVAGAVLGGHDGRRGYIYHLAVGERYRRQGLGRRLVERCLAALRAAGIQKCHLFIYHENSAGIAFWQALGWTFREDIRVMSVYLAEEE